MTIFGAGIYEETKWAFSKIPPIQSLKLKPEIHQKEQYNLNFSNHLLACILLYTFTLTQRQ